MKTFLISAIVLGAASLASADLIFYVPAASVGDDAPTLTIHSVLTDFVSPGPDFMTDYNGLGGNPPVHAFEIAQNANSFLFLNGYTVDCGGDAYTGAIPPQFYGGYNPVPAIFGELMVPTMDCGGGDVLATELPTEFALNGAFPNPFNPTTTIEFALPSTELVSLNVYNINGQLVNTLVSGTMEQGMHQVTFDASNLASGVYLYTLEAGSFSETQKMVLVK